MADLTAERLREALTYDADTGIFTRRRNGGGQHAGDAAGWEDHGYIRINIDGEKYYAHRLVWLYVHGRWPARKIDHRDTKRTNNRFDNLREATDRVNSQNIRAAKSSNHTGVLGVSRKRKRFEARIRVGGAVLRLGIFDAPEQAHAAYVDAKRIYHEGCTL